MTDQIITTKRKQAERTQHPEGAAIPAVLSDIKMHEDVETKYGKKDRLQIIFQTDLTPRTTSRRSKTKIDR